MKKTLFILTCILLPVSNLFAQNAHFTTSGTIEYNKSVNQYAQMQKGINNDNQQWLQGFVDDFKKDHKQFLVLKSTLNFTNEKELFVPAKSDEGDAPFFGSPMSAQKNTIYTDFSTRQSTTQKQIFEQAFLVKDSIRKIKWKITGETREVAGYTCRRANGLMMDSIYVVAFYADKIHVSGGPESFNGLPGMILQVALPHENVIWTATKVTDTPVADNALVPPNKGKTVNTAELKTILKENLKGWGDQSDDFKGYLF